MWALSILFTVLAFVFQTQAETLNDRPVIGILDISNEAASGKNSKSGLGTFMHAQYVKFLESAGAIVVPIHYDNTYEETEYLMNRINGVLFTGGGLEFNDPETEEPIEYTRTARHIFNKAIELNDKGVHFPLWGTCMGHQLLLYMFYGTEGFMNRTDASSTSDPLHFAFTDKNSTKLFKDFPDELLRIAGEEPLTANFHNWGVLTERFLDPQTNLTQFYRLLATSTDRKGVSYVANTEAYNYPFFTAQYHAEVTEFTYAYSFTNHSDPAREFAYLLAYKFVDEARKNFQKFDSFEELVSLVVQTTGTNSMGRTASGGFYDNYIFEPTKKVFISE